MRIVSLVEAQARLGELIAETVDENGFIIECPHQVRVRVSSLPPTSAVSKPRIGMLEGQLDVPDDFDTLGQEEIERLFGEI